MAIPTITIGADVIRELEAHCLREKPFEGCGILAGSGNRITRFFPIPNRDRSPHSFSFEPRAYLSTLKQVRQEQLELLGIVHSHPCTDPHPSTRDIREWHYPQLISWILSLKGDQPRLSAYYIRDGQVIPVIYLVKDGSSDRME
ncbi:MAG: M67 family metallopeptidase [Firmicutes bacterium]|uniref:Proteasome lid subunit RPN8/RPN11, contains Jab1/MPN metalloenzyme (JAMM) motif n=1 Tax=Melghirimyces thermohalophilus TaxID=1236220 RepID=A0A1G6QIT2_9BACL|nr:M67 family metallopeptidase [Melghirimyces thermohalophilus]MDA8354249.1 M67 family metallopeptidase [Bacillota bacterium]SDC92218.1 Proteasome lid subunit RPN8/RPN11, contains Jab1/MPN metalloenzyme (JAMM) motif [Melghirimyces thermohalophilus]